MCALTLFNIINRLEVRPCTNVGALTIVEHRLKNDGPNTKFTKFYLKLACICLQSL